MLIPRINKKYGKFDFSDPKNQKIAEKYYKEYEQSFKKVLDSKMRDLVGDRPSA